ncbi:MAG: carbohydrate kinase [Chitinophagia bacterium]|jgi:fructokinase|nr:carbohydrate kinase [Chitinophagia bacterium]
MKEQLVIGIGEILWDIFPEKSLQIMGGAPANFVFHTAQMGLQSLLISAIGKDDLGLALHKELEQHQIKHQIQMTNYETGSVLVSLDEKGIPTYEIKEPVAWDFIDANETLLATAKLATAICFGSLAQRNEQSHKTILKIVNSTSTNALRIFDINLRQHFYTKSIIEASMKACNVLKLNDDELVQLPLILNWKADQENNIIAHINKYFPNIHTLILTKGAEGSSIYNQDGICLSTLGTPNTTIVDTVGAGDAFTAAFVAYILKGHRIAAAHQKAVELAAFVCSQAGAIPLHP